MSVPERPDLASLPQDEGRTTPRPGSRLTDQGEMHATLVLSPEREAPLSIPGTTSGLRVPGQLGRYKLLAELGRGGMGTVYRALDTQLNQEVAVKVPHFDPGDQGALERFYTEVRTARRLRHPNICAVYDVNEVDGVHHMTMAYLEGEPLSDQIAQYVHRSPQEAAALVRKIALALEEAHRQGIIHRDLKPQNIMMDRRSEPIIMDFGLARETHTRGAGQGVPGTILGTPAYMPPEQVMGDLTASGPASDVYSLGVIFFELLTGQVPFRGNTREVLEAQVRAPLTPPSLLRPAVDAHAEAICLKATAKEYCQRFLTMADLAQAVEDYLNGVPRTRSLLGGIEEAPLERAAAELLVLLRTWGWETAVDKARQRPPEAAPETEAEADVSPFELVLRWVSGDFAARDEALAQLPGLRQAPALTGWAFLGKAFLANRDHQFSLVEDMLREASGQGDARDYVLRASIAHQRGFFLYHAGRLDEALAALHEALDLCGRDHFVTGQVLDTLGLVYANKNNFNAAREFFEQAIFCKERFNDPPAISRSLRQLGQLYLDWGCLQRSEETFQRSLQMALRSQDERGQANTFHYLGRVFLARGEHEAQSGRRTAARRLWTRAGEWLDAAIRSHTMRGRGILAGHAHRDRTLLHLAEGDLVAAETHIVKAEAMFTQVHHLEGLARVQEVRGILLRRQKNYEASEKCLRMALAHFDAMSDYAEGTRTQLEIGRTLSAADGVPQLVVEAFLEALRRAERCRRTELVRAAEEELRAADEEAHWQHVFHRARGRGATLDTSSLVDGESEVATALFLNLNGFVPFCQGLDSGDVMQTVNQVMADLADVLEHHRAQVTSYLGGGFMALIREGNHAERAAAAALEMIAVVEAFNRPRTVLGLRELPAGIGVATGTMFLGNIGTYHKMDFTAIGSAVNLASRLTRLADPRFPCISTETYQLTRDRFEFATSGPRTVDLPGLGRREIWDVVSRKKEVTRP